MQPKRLTLDLEIRLAECCVNTINVPSLLFSELGQITHTTMLRL